MLFFLSLRNPSSFQVNNICQLHKKQCHRFCFSITGVFFAFKSDNKSEYYLLNSIPGFRKYSVFSSKHKVCCVCIVSLLEFIRSNLCENIVYLVNFLFSRPGLCLVYFWRISVNNKKGNLKFIVFQICLHFIKSLWNFNCSDFYILPS